MGTTDMNFGGLTVHRLGFGAMRITGEGIWGEPRDPAEARRVLQRAVELGVNFIDTADSYGPNVSEQLIGDTLAPYRDGVVIATKGGLTRQGPNKWAPVGRPEYLRQQVEMSLRRLRLERIDLYQLHRIDPKVPVEESLGALKDLRSEGKIRDIGMSEISPEEADRAPRQSRSPASKTATISPTVRTNRRLRGVSSTERHSFPGSRWRRENSRSPEECWMKRPAATAPALRSYRSHGFCTTLR